MIKKILFFVGCILFLWGLFMFTVFTFASWFDWFGDASKQGHRSVKDALNMNLYTTTIMFLVGTYLISNNNPEKKD